MKKYSFIHSAGLFLASFILVQPLCGMLKRPVAVRPQSVAAKKGIVILVLGTSSAGKTRISGDVKDYLESTQVKPVVISEDTEDDRGISSDVRKKYPANWTSEHVILCQEIEKKAHENNVVIADLILFESKDYNITESFIERLNKQTNVISVLAYCPLTQLLKNVQTRNASGDDRECRSPVGVTKQYLERYAPSASSSLSEEDSEVVDLFDERGLQEGLKQFSMMEAKACEKKVKQECEQELQALSSSCRSVSPIAIDKNLYNVIIKNDGENFEASMGTLFYRLFKLLQKTSFIR